MKKVQDDLQIPSSLPEDFVPTPNAGLSSEAVQKLREAGLGNHEAEEKGKSVGQIIAENLFTFFNLLNFALGLAIFAVGSYRNLLFLSVVVTNTLIGTVQELRARRTIRKLKVLSAPTCHVLRDGKEITCPPTDLVRGDLVVLRAGDQVVADSVVLSGQAAANEALLTGESDAVKKQEGSWLMSGSYVTEGKCTAQLVHVGADSYVNRLTKAAKVIKRPKSALMTDLNRLLHVLSCILVPVGLLLFAKQHFLSGRPLPVAIPSAVGAMIGMIPEGLLLLTSVAMTVGVIRLGQKQTLVQELYGIETLARADVLCLDKTGTITTGNMQGEGILPLDGNEGDVKAALSRFLGAFECTSGTLAALTQLAPPVQEKTVGVLPFSSARKKSAASFADGKTLILGAVSFVLGDHIPKTVQDKAESTALAGHRVLVLAQAEGCVSEEDTPPVTKILGLLLLGDEVRPHAAETLRYFEEQCVSVRVISGDDPRTVSHIARKVGLKGWDKWVDATTLQDDASLDAACQQYTVFGRVTPGQKKRLVEALKRAGHSVAMTGDGVNDIPALKAADCSIAMAGGSDAAKHASQLTLLGADFAAMPQIVAEGRRVVNNVTRSASLFLVKTCYSFLVSVLLLLLPAAYPFQPIQLTLISTLTIGVPSLFLALEANDKPIRGDFLKTVLLQALPGGLTVTLCALLAMLLENFSLPLAEASTLSTLCAALVGLMMLCRVSRPLNLWRILIASAMALGLALSVAFLGKLFLIVWPQGTMGWTLPAFLALTPVVFALISILCGRVLRKDEKA